MWLLPILNAMAIMMTVGTTIYGIFVKYVTTRARKLMPELAYPEGYRPVIGHVLEFIHHCTDSATLWHHMNYYCEYYKEGFLGLLGHQIWLFIPDHEVMQEVLASHEEIEKCYIYQSLNCITDGVFIAPGYRWRKLRKRLNLTFNAKQMENYMEVVNDRTDVFLNTVIRKVAQTNQYVDIQPYLSRFFFDIVTKTHFGVDTNEQVVNKHQVTEQSSMIVEWLIEGRLLRPHLQLDLVFHFTKLYKDICRVRGRPFQYISSMIEKGLKIAEGQKKAPSEKLYIEMVVEALKEMNIPPTIDNIQLNSNDLLVAGSDTSSITGGALLYFLALHKDIQQKVYEEVSKIYGQDSYKPLTRQDLNSMTYLDMVVNEALRWSAPAGILREFNRDFNAGKYILPKNSNMYLVMSSLHRNPDYYEKVNEFYPEHFTPEAIKSRPKMTFIPFSSGPRNCPGKVFAYVLIKNATAALINNYHVDTNLPLKDVKCKVLLMTQHVQGYPIRLTPRQRTLPSG